LLVPVPSQLRDLSLKVCNARFHRNKPLREKSETPGGRRFARDHALALRRRCASPNRSEAAKRLIKQAGLAEGLTADEARSRADTFSGHSLRSGLATSAAENDAPGHSIQRQLRHKSFTTTIGYIRSGSLFKGNAASFALK
jgi:integrase